MANFKTFTTAKANPDMAGVQDVDPQEVWQNRDQVALIDVRRPDEFNGELGHIDGAKLIVLDTLPDNLEEIPKDKTIVFVCRSGNRSGRAVAWALSEGYTSVYNMLGGMLLWNQKKMEVKKNG